MKQTPYEMLSEFHRVYGVGENQEMTEKEIELRLRLINEEFGEVEKEFDKAWETGERHLNFEETFFNSYGIDKKKLTKELADLMYVTIGTATKFGLPLEQVFEEVHKSNMSKLGDDGKPIYREDGKVLKGPNYKEPDLEKYFNV